MAVAGAEGDPAGVLLLPAMRKTPPGTNSIAVLEGTNGAALLVRERDGVNEAAALAGTEEPCEPELVGDDANAACDRRLIRFTAGECAVGGNCTLASGVPGAVVVGVRSTMAT